MYTYDLVVLGIFRDEESFLPDWIDHYLRIGIDHLYLLNDNSSDSSVDIIQSHPSFNKQISLVHIHKEDMNYKKYWRQEYLYNKYCSSLLKKTRWIGVFDLDEFCYSPRTSNIKNLILQFDHTNIQELLVDWYWFGSNDFIDQPANIIHSFTYRSNLLSKHISKSNTILNNTYHHDWCCKSFAKTATITSIRPHYNKYNYNGISSYISHGKNIKFSHNLSDDGNMYINHYVGSKNYYFTHKTKRCCNNHHKNLEQKIPIYNMINLNEIRDTRLRDQIYV